jgi:hypothetical protein
MVKSSETIDGRQILHRQNATLPFVFLPHLGSILGVAVLRPFTRTSY